MQPPRKTCWYLQHALDGVDSSQQVQASAEHAQHAGDDTWESHRLQQLGGSCKTTKEPYRFSRVHVQSPDVWSSFQT